MIINKEEGIIVLILKNCTKSFKKTKALNDFSCEFKHGIYGLLGPNGSGKTTMMRCICGLLSPEKGSIECDCENIGYLPQQFGAMKSLTVYETMRYFATLKKIPKSNQDNEIRYCIDLVNLSDKIKNKVGSLSGGMVRRLGIAQAIMGNPEIVLFDEPTAGLDPKERIRIRNFISEIAEDKIVLISTHVVSDIEFIAKEIILLNQGKLVSHDTCQNLVNEIVNKVVEVEIEKEELKYFQDNYRVSNLYHNDDKIVVRLVTDNPPENHKITIANPTLEDLYLYIFEQGM